MSNFKKGNIVDVKPVTSSKFRGCILRVFDGDCGDKLATISNLDDGTVGVFYEYEIDPNVVISDINDFGGDS